MYKARFDIYQSLSTLSTPLKHAMRSQSDGVCLIQISTSGDTAGDIYWSR